LFAQSCALSCVEVYMAHILIAEDEPGLRRFLTEALEGDGHDIVAVEDGRAALAALRKAAFDVLVTDLNMPHCDGMTVVRTIRAEQPDVEIIVLTAFGEVATAVEALKLGAFDYREKPLASPKELRGLVTRALTRRAALARPGEAPPSAPFRGDMQLTWGARTMTPVVDAIERVAKTSATVLLEGESGTGKEIFARTIHNRSVRAAKPFLAINCAVLSANLIESELFGHEKGAFTGAHVQRRGRIELADGGTLFLDEVAELAPSLQAKLLRVLEEKCFERVGGSKSIQVDVRWVAATHRPLAAMVQAGTFREDLYHRLAVFPVEIPPLRCRQQDIIPLAEVLLAQLSEGRPTPQLSDSAKSRLRSSAWPGNVRQLRNALERAMILHDGPMLEESLFAGAIQPVESSLVELNSADSSLEGLERQAIASALAAVGGNRRAAAARLGIGLRTLYEKLKRYETG
jgi:two-component system, NtrC family, response regulator AtoC